MEKSTKITFFLVIACVMLAAFLPTLAIAAFGITGGLLILAYAVMGICTLLWPK